jgi:hypothetical protein
VIDKNGDRYTIGEPLNFTVKINKNRPPLTYSAATADTEHLQS